MEKQQKQSTKTMNFTGIFAVACVLFSSHAGGGFATGNQATQYYVQYGWAAPFMAVIAMALLTLTIRECMIMYNSRGLSSYKELFQNLYHPFDKFSVLFDIYFYTMVVCAVGAVIAGAASLLNKTYSIHYVYAVLSVGAILLTMTIFGASLVSKASTVMSIGILATCGVIFILGINAKIPEISTIFAVKPSGGNIGTGIFKAFTYAGFQSVVIPTMISCGKSLKNSKEISRSMLISFVINSFALVLSVVMLLVWYADFTQAGETTLPTLFIAGQLGKPYVFWAYNICLFLCFISTGVTTIYGFVTKFEKAKALSKINNVVIRRIIVSFIIMFISMGISMVGLDRIIKYGYGYMGYFGIAIIIVPFLTVGAYKNRKFLREQSNNINSDNANLKSSFAEGAEY
ncbi:hypothetical protein HZF24_00065 [Sedimentibacter hydroxybenzoicus DSM 7310]|uniref:Membrane protein YkvI n=1 Tax=Sedimentibacter hydroxybenzoicus DSM 7310 TaxID=1123245 RepID=A0A974BGP7_SEDHY|nr:hypothetical protein [Sedimentibacter hydroxybenzoicus]NYB72527.1 hypothetical protein [Sedimentibacter hydroxybenzoicus DSM 7310]